MKPLISVVTVCFNAVKDILIRENNTDTDIAMTVKHNNSSLWVLLFFCPALCFFNALRRLKNGNVGDSKIIPVIMGLFAYLFPPYSDFARNLDLVYSCQGMPWEYLMVFVSDPIIPSIEYYFVKYGIPIEIFRFIYTYFIYYIFTLMFIDIQYRFQLSKIRGFKCWLFLFMMIQFFIYIINLRTLLVSYSLIYCVYKYYYNFKDKYRYYSLMLCLIHFAYIPIVLCFFFSKYINIRYSITIRNILLVLTLLSGFITIPDFATKLIGMFSYGDVIDNKFQIYTEGEWSSEGEAMMQMRTTNYMIYTTLLSMCNYYIYYLYMKYISYNIIDKYVNLLILLVLFTFPIGSLFNRYVGFLAVALQLLVLYGYVTGKISEKNMNIVILLCVFNTLLNVYAHWNCLVNGNVWYLLTPLPIALIQTYNFEEWCNYHLSDDFNEFIHLSIFSR